jgi:hypothetical protein
MKLQPSLVCITLLLVASTVVAHTGTTFGSGSEAGVSNASETDPAQTNLEAQIDQFLRQSGHQYGKVKANSWYINVTGKNLPRIRIILGAGSNSIAMGAVVVSKRDLVINAESMLKMMKLSYDLNYVRVCIDVDDDLIVMSQLKDTWLDLPEFKKTIDVVAAAADRAYGEIRPHVRTP